MIFCPCAVQSLQQLSAPKISSHLRRSVWWSVCARVSSETPPTPHYPPGAAIFKQWLSCLLAARLQLLCATFRVSLRSCSLHSWVFPLFTRRHLVRTWRLFLSVYCAFHVSLAGLLNADCLAGTLSARFASSSSSSSSSQSLSLAWFSLAAIFG